VTWHRTLPEASASPSWGRFLQDYETKIAQRFELEQQVELPIPMPAAATETKQAAK
jgi:hypothetical protein